MVLLSHPCMCPLVWGAGLGGKPASHSPQSAKAGTRMATSARSLNAGWGVFCSWALPQTSARPSVFSHWDQTLV